MKKLIRFIKSVFGKNIAQCYECGKHLTAEDEIIIDPFYTTEERKMRNAFNPYQIKDTYCTKCKDFLSEANRIVNREW